MLNISFWCTIMVLVNYIHSSLGQEDIVYDSNQTSTVRIISVSVVQGQEFSVPAGSTEGGTRLFLKVQGLDKNPSNNAIYIGKYPCLSIEQGKDGQSITCETTKTNSKDNDLSNLEIVVRVVGKNRSLCLFSDVYCFFTYIKEKTRLELKLVSPRSNFPNRLSSWKAQWGINSTQQLKGQMIGIHRCVTANLINEIDGNDNIDCRLPKDIIAGEYDYSFLTFARISNKGQSLSEKKIFSDETYESKIIPIITSLNTNFGSPKGSVLTINGYGFSSITSENVITITNQNLNYGDSMEILSSTNTRIKVKLPDINDERYVDPAESNKKYISGSGLFYTKYNLEGQDTYYENCEEFRRQLLENPSTFTNLIETDGIYPEPEISFFSNKQYFGEYLRGFLKAPSTGNYKFYLSSQNQALFYMQTELTMNATSSNQVAAKNTWNPFRNYWYSQVIDPQSENPSISNSIELTKDQFYFIELFRVSKEQNQYLTLSMEMENNSGKRKKNSIKQIWKITTSSPPISGSFELELSINNSVNNFMADDGCQDIPFDFSAELMADNFERIIGSRPIVQTYGEANDGWTWMIQFQTSVEHEMDIKINNNNLIGNISVVNIIQENDNFLFEPIPNEILYTYSDKLQVQVETKGILAGCETRSTCDFTINGDRILTLMSYEVNGSKLNLTLNSGQGKKDLFAKDLIITFLNAACFNIQVINSASPYQVICDIEQFNGENIQVAGKNQYPIVYDKNTGYSLIDEDLQGTDVDIVISSLYPTNGTQDGGTLVTLQGTGFPKFINSDLIIELPDKAQIISVNPNEIKFLTVPNMKSEEMRITVNNMSANFQFFVNTKTRMEFRSRVTTLYPYKIFPIEISGSNFGAILEDLTVTFKSSRNTYSFKPESLTEYVKNPPSFEISVIPFEIEFDTYQILLHRANFGYGLSVKNVITVDLHLNCYYPQGSPSGGFNLQAIFDYVYEGSFLYLKLLIANQLLVSYDQNFIMPPLPEGIYDYQIIFPGLIQSSQRCQYTSNSTLQLKLDKYPENSIMYVEEGQTKYKKYYELNETETLTGQNLGYKVIIMIGNFSVSTQISENSFTFQIPTFLNPGEYLTQVQNNIGNADKSWITVILQQEQEIELLLITPKEMVGGGAIQINFAVNGFIETLPIHELIIGLNKQPKCSFYNDLLMYFSCEMTYPIKKEEAKIYISQFQFSSSLHNSQILKEASLSFPFLERDNYPIVTSIAINGVDTQNIDNQAAKTENGNFSITIEGDNLNELSFLLLPIHDYYWPDEKVRNSTTLITDFINQPPGIYRVSLSVLHEYFALFDETKLTLDIEVGMIPPEIESPLLAYSGGQLIKLKFSKDIRMKQQNLKVNVCGLECQIEIMYGGLVQCKAPTLLTESLFQQIPPHLQKYRLLAYSELILSADNSNVYNLNDNKEETYYESDQQTCFVQFNFGFNRTLSLIQFSFLPRIDLDARYLIGGMFQYTVDGITWLPLLKIEETIFQGWNHFILPNVIQNIEILKFIDDKIENNSKCQFAEIKLKGEIFFKDHEPLECDVEISYGQIHSIQSLPRAVTYTNMTVPIVEKVIPEMLVAYQDFNYTIIGKGFTENETQVTFCGYQQRIQNITSNKIDVMIGGYGNNKLEVRVNQIQAINLQEPKIVFKIFSDDYYPQEIYYLKFLQDGDSFTIPKGVIFLLDRHLPKFNQIIVHGTLMFSDEKDMQLRANQIFLQGGTLQIGSEIKRHKHKVTITLHGIEQDSEFPGFGNKFIGCQECKILIFGEERKPLWTYLQCTAEVGQIEITLDDEVDWRIGEQIIIVTNSYDNSETEKKQIVAISEDRKTLLLDSPLIYRHYSAQETFNEQIFLIKTEVALLTRNILIQGEQSNNNYGYHLFIDGTNEQTQIQISFTEFRFGGQNGIKNRFPVNFRLNGLQEESYFVGNSIHDSYARCINLQGVQHLNISENLCYNILGHGIALQSGTEINNIIEKNLVINTKETWTLEETDIAVASFWITNPRNIIRMNRAVASDWNGFYYDLKLNPFQFICPTGMRLLQFDNNLAHSNKKAGLEIKQLSVRVNSCDRTDNYVTNPSLQAVFQNFKSWRSDFGIVLDRVQNIVLKNIFLSDFRHDGISYHELDISIHTSIIQDSIFIVKLHEDNILSTTKFINATQQLLQKNLTQLNITDSQLSYSSCFINSPNGNIDNSSNSNSNSSSNSSSTNSNNSDNVQIIQEKKKYWTDPNAWENKIVPKKGENVTIRYGYLIILNISPPELSNLEIQGTLSFDPKQEIITLTAEKILVTSSGMLIAGNSTSPFPGKINIILIGQENNQIIVSKSLIFYSSPPRTTWTRLKKIPKRIDGIIEVEQCQDWKAGDEIVIGPTFTFDTTERTFIYAISPENCSIMLYNPIKYYHQEGETITINKPGIGQLDMRVVVLHISRNITIKSNKIPFQVIIQNSHHEVDQIGNVILQGVEFNYCGGDSMQGGLDFSNSKISSEIIGCSFHDSKGIQLNIQNSEYIRIFNNVFFNGTRALVQINNSKNIKFQNNAMIYVQKNTYLDEWAVLGNFVYLNETVPTRMIRDIVDISGNVGSGSQDTGFFVMSSSCTDSLQTSFYDNECSASKGSCFAIRQSNGTCDYIQGMSTFHSKIGVQFAINSAELRLENVISAENAIHVMFASGSNNPQNNKIYFSNSYVTAIAYPSCYDIRCVNNQEIFNHRQGAIMLGSVFKKVFPPLSSMPSSQFNKITSTQQVDCQVYINSVQFDQFRHIWNGIFKTNQNAFDMTGQHYLSNTTCTNCNLDGIMARIEWDYQDLQDQQYDLLNEVSGQKNVLIEDQTGHFFGQISQAILGKNQIGKQLNNCITNMYWNGYWCSGRNLTALMFMSVAPDYKTNVYDPVYLSDGEIENKIDSFSDWSDQQLFWQKKEAKYISLVRVSKVIRITGVGENPTDTQFWLSKRNDYGNPEDFIIIQWQFNISLMIIVSVNNTIIQPGISAIQEHYNLSQMNNQCGLNNYFYENKTIEFLINGELGCLVRISVKNTLYVRTQLLVKNTEFSVLDFLDYARSTLGGNPQNYFYLDQTVQSNRLLQEGEQEIVIEILWGIVDDAQIGTKISEKSQENLSKFASALESFVPPPELGIVKQQTSKIVAMSNLKYSDYQIESLNETSSTQNSSNNNSYSELDINLNEIVNENETIIDEDENNQTMTQKDAISQNSDSSMAIIVVSIICFIIFIFASVFGYRYWKAKKVRVTPLKSPTLETIRIFETIDPQLQCKSPQPQSLQ